MPNNFKEIDAEKDAALRKLAKIRALPRYGADPSDPHCESIVFWTDIEDILEEDDVLAKDTASPRYP